MTESQIIHTPDSTGAGVRTIAVQTVVNGTLTTVQMQVVSLADESGNVIKNFADYNLQLSQLAELRAIRSLFARYLGVFEPIQDGPTIGSVQQ